MAINPPNALRLWSHRHFQTDTDTFIDRAAAPSSTSPPFLAGFQLTDDIEIPDGHDASGIICAHHHWFHSTFPGGWACYLVNGRLTVTFNPSGVATHIVAVEAMLAGRHEVRITLERPPDHEDGSIGLTIDDREVGTGHIANSHHSRYVHGKLLIGRDQGLPVSDDYEPPFPFSGNHPPRHFRSSHK